MAEPLPSEFDVVVLGTGLAESIVSAAASRNGHTVLHLDPREYYGGKWATLSWDALISGSFAENPEHVSTQSNLTWTNAAKDFEQFWYLESDDVKADALSQSRRFNIDLYPKALLAREEIISLLIGSNVSRYLEFLRIAKLMASLPPPSEDTIESIPLSRSDIFTSKSIGLVEKRGLVKLIESVLKTDKDKIDNEEDEGDEPESIPKTFEELTITNKISDKVKHFIRSAVKILDDGFESSKGDLFETEFSERCRVFLQSIGRYGNQTPYLWTLYGISEICQAFCRLSAVYRGIFILNRFIDSIKETETGFDIVAKDVAASTKILIVGPEISMKNAQKAKVTAKTIGRGILLTNGLRIKNEKAEKVTGDGSQLYIYKIRDMEVIELDHTSQAVPKNYCLIHVTFPYTSSYTTSPKEIIEKELSAYLDFKPSINEKTSNDLEKGDTPVEPATNDTSATPDKPVEGKPQVLYGAYFLMDFFESESYENADSNPKIFSCATDSTEITAEVNKAREIFTKMFPEEEFLPKAPDAAERDDEDDEEDPQDESAPINGTAENEGEVKDGSVESKPQDDSSSDGISKEGDGDANK